MASPRRPSLSSTSVPGCDSQAARPLISSAPPQNLYAIRPFFTSPVNSQHSHLTRISDPTNPNRQPMILPARASNVTSLPPKAYLPRSGNQIVPNPVGFPAPVRNPMAVTSFPTPSRPYGFSPGMQGSQLMQRSPVRGSGSSSLSNTPIIFHPKAVPYTNFPPKSDLNNYKESRDKSKEDIIVTIIDRKVRVYDDSSESLYPLCRSWVRNGLSQESQDPHISELGKLLPKPLPVPATGSNPLKRTNGDDGEDDSSITEDKETVEHLSAQELLQSHVKHAKRVRVRLKEERLQRIDRYKQRLALLLPPPTEQGRNDVDARN